MASTVDMWTLDGARVLVVGASSGIGRELGRQAAAAGARVAFAARREALVQEAAATAGAGAIALVCDTRDEASCRAVVADTVAAFGGLDAVVYSTAIDVLVRLADASMETWANTFATNIFGAAVITAAALDAIKASRGRMLYISASSIDRPLPGMGVYASSKAAMETMIKGWQAEHPDVAFSNVRVGSTLGTGVTDSWDRPLLMELSKTWGALGYTHDNGPGDPMGIEEATAAIVQVLASPVWQRDITIVSDPRSKRS